MNAANITHGLKVVGFNKSMVAGVVVLMLTAVIIYAIWLHHDRQAERQLSCGY